jgi:hypothetical protein
MIRALFSRVSRLYQHALARFRHTDPPKADSAERRERWNQVFADHKRLQEPTEVRKGDS